MDKFIKECDCDLIQKLWKPKVGDNIYDKNYDKVGVVDMINVADKDCAIFVISWLDESGSSDFTPNESTIWLPSLSQIIAEIEKLPQLYSWNIQNSWNLPHTWDTQNPHNRYIRASIFTDVDVIEVKGKTPELAAIKALKQVLKEGK